MESDAINPDHYKRLPVEAIEIIESAIENAPSHQDAYLHGQVLKYILRCWSKNGIEDLNKAKWYLDRLIEHCDESPIDLNKGLVKAWTCEDGKAKQVYPEPKWEPKVGEWVARPCGRLAKVESVSIVGGQIIYGCEGTTTKFTLGTLKPWTPKVGDWVKINKPKPVDDFLSIWMPGMDRFDGQIVQVKEIDDDASVHDDWAYISKAIIDDEWAFLFDWLEPAEAPQQPAKEQPQLPDGWRWLEVGEVIRDGDKFFKHDEWMDCRFSIGDKLKDDASLTIRRNRFEVGEKVVDCVHNRIGVVKDIEAIGKEKDFLYHVEMQDTKMEFAFNPNQIAPYIEDAT